MDPRKRKEDARGWKDPVVGVGELGPTAAFAGGT